MSELYYCISGTAGSECGEGTKFPLSTDDGSSALEENINTADTWNLVFTLASGHAASIKAGTWTVTADVRIATVGFGTDTIRCTVKHRNSACTTQATIINAVSEALAAGTHTITFENASAPQCDLSDGDVITVEFAREAGGRTAYLRYNGADGGDSDSRVSIPNRAFTCTVAAAEVRARPKMVGQSPEIPTASWIDGPDIFQSRLDASNTPLTIGVDAYSSDSIAKVVFAVTPDTGTYNGQATYTFSDVTGVTYNSATDAWGYHVSLVRGDFSANTAFTVSATVYGNNGGRRTKDNSESEETFRDLRMVVDTDGTLPKPEAWANNATGNDSQTPLYDGIDDDTKPYETIHGAAKAIEAWMSNEGHGSIIDGGRIRLVHSQGHGFHNSDETEIVTTNEVCRILPTSGHDKTDTEISSGHLTQKSSKIKYLRIENILMETDELKPVIRRNWSSPVDGAHLYVVNCKATGGTRMAVGPIQKGASEISYGDTEITLQQKAVENATFCHNVNAHALQDDAYYNARSLINCIADDLDPGVSEVHSDYWQLAGKRFGNVLCVNFEGTRSKMNGFILHPTEDGTSRQVGGLAIVNCRLHKSEGSWMFHLVDSTDNLVMLHNTIEYDGTPEEDDAPLLHQGTVGFGVPRNNPSADVDIMHALIKGNYFSRVLFAGGNQSDGLDSGDEETFNLYIDTSGSTWDHNGFYFEATSQAEGQTPGTNIVTSDPLLDVNGIPAHNSPLAKTIDPLLVLFDLSNETRRRPTTIGAYELPNIPLMGIVGDGTGAILGG